MLIKDIFKKSIYSIPSVFQAVQQGRAPTLREDCTWHTWLWQGNTVPAVAPCKRLLQPRLRLPDQESLVGVKCTQFPSWQQPQVLLYTSVQKMYTKVHLFWTKYIFSSQQRVTRHFGNQNRIFKVLTIFLLFFLLFVYCTFTKNSLCLQNCLYIFSMDYTVYSDH